MFLFDSRRVCKVIRMFKAEKTTSRIVDKAVKIVGLALPSTLCLTLNR